MGSNEKAILRTLVYSSVFQFPLSEEELFYYFIADHAITKAVLQTSLKNLKAMSIQEKGLLALPNEEASIARRKISEDTIKQKRSLAVRFAQLLGTIPTVYFIGISGSVGVGQAKDNDDIDLFIITKKHSLFVTRLFILLFLSLVGKRRKRMSTTTGDLFCVNMILDETAIEMPQVRRDLYTAHEMVQMYPLFERKQMYDTFLHANAWVQEYLPHTVAGRGNAFVHAHISWTEHLFLPFEPLVRWLQLMLIRRHRTRETVRPNLVAFHPTDYKTQVLAAYEKQLQLYEKYYNTTLRAKK